MAVILKRVGALMTAGILAACSSAASPSQADPSASVAPASVPASETASEAASEPVVLRFSDDSPVGSPQDLNDQLFATEVARLSGGTVEVVVYPAAQLYAEEDVLAAMQRSEVDMGVVPDWAPVDPAVLILDLPFEFASWDEFHTALDGEIGEMLTALYESHGIKHLYFQDNTAIDLVGTRDTLVQLPDDLDGKRMRTFSEPFSQALTIWGGAPTQLSGAETYSAVERGTVDGIVSGVSFYERNWYEVTPYISQFPFSFRTNAVQMSLEVWDSLSPDQQEAIIEAAAIAQDANREETPDVNLEAYAQLAELSEEFHVGTDEEIESWRASTTGMRDWYLEQAGDSGQAFLDALPSD